MKERELRTLREKVAKLTELEKIHTADIEHLVQNNEELERTSNEQKKNI